MLELRPNCESCDKDLPYDSTEAMICTYECTFCRSCVEHILNNVCPNCGGGFVTRPIRPKIAWRDGVSISFQPPSSIRVNTKYSKEDLNTFTGSIKHLNPEER